ncbi:uncharacterized protein IL334_005816 [Kwoniella shivajii]|uniref:Shugoshin C-terminal domain-containing protein n=1 Tax=Kwoniella shivajii TaxID=564305 RepID=A0ABZ1D4L0_9TREE|nr:hypothetical protein IL334_005816 [Kwoniella shivajii]
MPKFIPPKPVQRATSTQLKKKRKADAVDEEDHVLRSIRQGFSPTNSSGRFRTETPSSPSSAFDSSAFRGVTRSAFRGLTPAVSPAERSNSTQRPTWKTHSPTPSSDKVTMTKMNERVSVIEEGNDTNEGVDELGGVEIPRDDHSPSFRGVPSKEKETYIEDDDRNGLHSTTHDQPVQQKSPRAFQKIIKGKNGKERKITGYETPIQEDGARVVRRKRKNIRRISDDGSDEFPAEQK